MWLLIALTWSILKQFTVLIDCAFVPFVAFVAKTMGRHMAH